MISALKRRWRGWKYKRDAGKFWRDALHVATQCTWTELETEMKQSEQHCENCRFFLPTGNSDGRCRRWPAQVAGGQWRQPGMLNEQWCGEWEGRSDDNAEK